MRKQLRVLISVLTILMMIGTLCACGKSSEETFTGKLIDARADTIVVRGDTATMQFITTSGTQYTLQNENELTVGDELEVQYHEQSGRFAASSVKVTKHEEELLVLGGKITDMNKNTLTIQSESLSVRFTYDDKTAVQGSPTKGDYAAITYEGDISKTPHAVSIVITEGNREETLAMISGTVSEVTKNTVLVSLDSSGAKRFDITEDTIIGGDATKLKVGDKIKLAYTGDLDEEPVARTIKVSRKDTRDYYILDGWIENITEKGITVNSGKKSYKLKFSEETKVENRNYLARGHKTTVTYTGELGKKPVAVMIYCSKGTVSKEEMEKSQTKKETKKTKKATKKTEPKKTETKKTETKATDPTKTDPTVTEETETKATDPTETDPTVTEETETQDTEASEPTQTDPTVTEEPETEDTEATEPTQAPASDDEMLVIKSNATIYKGDETKATFKIEGGGIIELDITDCTFPSGYLPQVGDEVIISYDKTDMKLLDIQLVYRPDAGE